MGSWPAGVGEGWHNNHHAFPRSAFHGLHWWQIDFSGYLIRFLERIGLATEVYRIPAGNASQTLSETWTIYQPHNRLLQKSARDQVKIFFVISSEDRRGRNDPYSK